MGSWGTGVFENDTALDTIAEMSGLIDNYYKKLAESDDEHNIMLSAFLYIATHSGTIYIDENCTDKDVKREIKYILNGLSKQITDSYKYIVIGKLYKCLDDAKYWNEDCRADRKKTIQEMIDFIAKEN